MGSFNPRAGAETLIMDAIGARPGDSLAIIAEDPSLGFYDSMVPLCVSDVAEQMGISVEIIQIDSHVRPEFLPSNVRHALLTFDHVLFHSRLGDTLRFSEIPGGATKTMSYALDISILGGPSCTVSHSVMEEIRSAYDSRADCAETWQISCKNGTEIIGTQDIGVIARGEAEDFTVTRFPVCASRPISCDNANGIVVFGHWLMASGNQQYPECNLILDGLVSAIVENGNIRCFEGPSSLVAKVEAHYRRVGEFLGLNPWNVHSWHAGINPGCSYPVRGLHNIERWGKVAFANPRYLHFHTCGEYAPGEIAWSLFDVTIKLGNEIIWDDGKLVFLDGSEVRKILNLNKIESLEVRQDIGID